MLGIRRTLTVFPKRTSVAAAGAGARRAAGGVPSPWTTGKMSFIGGGRMAEAMLRCLCKAGSMENIFVYDPNEARTSILKARYGVTIADSADDAIVGSEYVVSIATNSVLH
jgi:ornithine cyclodeaminase/alanine dehydrogenase-like protein (mu-crystallin family)